MDDSIRQAEFLRRLSDVFDAVYSAAVVIVGNRHDTDDIIQEVCIIMWQKYDDFEPGTDFRKWACSIAFRVAKNFVRKRRRRSFGLSDYALSKIAHVQQGGTELFELRRTLLRRCLVKLQERDRLFLKECYGGALSLTKLARSKNTSVQTIYTRLKRLRRKLADCIQSAMGKGA